MWPDGEAPVQQDARLGRPSSSSDVVVINERMLAAAAHDIPTVSNLNVTKSSRVHIGPKFVSVTQNVQNNEVVKGRFLGLELVSPKQARRLRCSVAVFVCWAVVVASGLAVYLFHFALPKQTRLDIDLPLPQYLWVTVKNTTRAERLACLVALLLVILCIFLIVYFAVIAKDTEDVIDVAPHEWKITREMWLAKPWNTSDTTSRYGPLRLVIVQHTVSSDCPTFILCAASLRNLQSYTIRDCEYDIAYNFLIGNDGRVYEGRGWNIEGAHTKGFNRCSLGLGFIGDYREEKKSHSQVTEAQINRTNMLLEEGVKLRYLDPDYVVVGAKDLQATESPGSNLYNALKKWQHYDHKNLYHGMTCDQIYATPITHE